MGSRHRIRLPAIISVLFIALLVSLLVLPPGARTARAASSWESQASGTTADLTSVSAASATTLWAVGADGTILKTIDGGSTWQKQPSGLSSIWINDVCAVSETTAWVTGSTTTSPNSAIIARTTDGGATWEVKWTYSAYPTYMSGITAASANVAWACGTYLYDDTVYPPKYRGAIVNTKDGGKSWAVQYTVDPGGVTDISSVSSSTVWAARTSYGDINMRVLRTTNGGANWSAIPTTTYATHISAVDSNTAWVCDSYGEVRLTKDGGATWKDTLDLDQGSQIEFTPALTAASSTTAWITTDYAGGSIYGTRDGGDNWSLQATDAQCIGVDSFDNSNAWAVGYGGNILHTTGGGGTASIPKVLKRTPTSGPGGSAVTLSGFGFGSSRGSSSVSFGTVPALDYPSWTDKEIKVLVPLGAGPAGSTTITITTALGTTGPSGFRVIPWVVQKSSGVRLEDVSCVDEKTGWAVGGTPGGYPIGTIFRTDDGGNTWNAQTIPSSNELFSISTLDRNTAWAVGESSAVLKTTNGGTTWSPQSLPKAVSLEGVSAVDVNNVWIAGIDQLNPIIMRTADGGLTWTSTTLSDVNGYIRDIAAIDSQRAWALEYNRTEPYTSYVLKTTDGGKSWVNQTPGGYPGLLNRIDTVSASTAWAVGSSGLVIKTTDGSNWIKQNTGLYATLYDVSAVDADTAWFISEELIYKTIDGGASWHAQSQPDSANYDFRGVSAADRNVAFVVGGRILNTNDGGDGKPIPVVRSVEPAQGPVGSEVVLKGSGFWPAREASYVSFGTVKATDYTLWSDKEIHCKVPSMATGPANITVTNIYGTSNPFPFTVGTSTVPVVSAINPKTGVNNTKYAVEVLGTNFQATSKVRLQRGTTVINGSGVALAKPGRLTCYLDLKSKPTGKYDVFVTNPDGGVGKLAGGFTVVNVCGQGAAASISAFAGLLGLLSLAGLGWRRKRR